MNDFRDPTILHSAECVKCGFTYSDGDVLDENGVCPLCHDDADPDDEWEQGDPDILVRARERAASESDATAFNNPASYFGLAYDLTRR